MARKLNIVGCIFGMLVNAALIIITYAITVAIVASSNSDYDDQPRTQIP